MDDIITNLEIFKCDEVIFSTREFESFRLHRITLKKDNQVIIRLDMIERKNNKKQEGIKK